VHRYESSKGAVDDMGSPVEIAHPGVPLRLTG